MIAADATGFVQAIVVALLGGGLFGGIYALLKLRPEAGQISVTAAQGAVIVQTGVIESLREENSGLRQDVSGLRLENSELQQRVRTLEYGMGSVAEAHARIRTLEVENASLRDENMQLKDRVGMLELQLQGLEEGTT